MLYGGQFQNLNFTYQEDGDTSAYKAEMVYHSIYFSYYSVIQIAVINCHHGAWHPPRSEKNYDVNSDNFIMTTKCREYMDSVGVYKADHKPTDLTGVFIQGIQPFKNTYWFDELPQT